MIEPVTSAEFDTVADGQALTVVDFWAEWCGPCKMQTPILEDLSTELADQVKFASVDIDANPTVAERFQVMSIPTLIIFKNGQPAEKVVGFHAKGALQKYLTTKLAEATTSPADA